MLLLHTVLAVVCGGLLVSARPEPIRGRGWYAEDREFTDANVPSYEFQHGAPADFDDAWEWAPQGPQHILAHHAEGFPFPDPDREHWPESPHPHPESPRRDPEPPQFPPQYPQEPHYPPPPGPPPPPPYEGPPHFPHRPPHFPKPSDDTKEQTVYQFLEGHPKFSRLFKLVNYTEDVTNYLNDSSQSVSFFALPDFGFPKPPHHHDGDDNEDIEFEDLFQMREGSLGDMLAAAEGYLNSARKPDEGRIKAFIKYVLLYNVLPEHTPLHQLGKNNTFATALKLPDGSLDGKPLRIRVNRNIGLDPRPSVNFISKIIVPDIPVKNGVIHVVNKPILPPPSIFQIGFLLSDAFSTFTSALQRVGLTDELDFRNVEDGSVEGSPAVSIFVPTNKAFARLPPKLKLFLFSPFGEKALKKLLQFHIVPEAVLHSDYFHNASQSEFALPRDTSEAGEFYAQLDQFPGAWSAILGEPSSLQWAGFSDEDAYESSGRREINFNPDAPVEPFHREAPHDASHFSFSGDAHPQHHDAFPWPPPPPPPPPHGSPHHPPHYPSPPPPEVWLHYPPPPPPPHHSQDGPHHPQDSPHHPPHFPPPPPLPHHPQDGPHHPPHHLPHFPSPPPPPDVWVHYPPPPPLPHGPHHPSHPPQDGPHHPQDSPHHPPHFPPPPPLPHHPQDGPHHPPHVPPPSPPDVWAHYPPPPHGPHHPPHFPSPPSPFEHLPHRPPFSPPPHRPHGWFPPPPGKLPKGGPPHHRPEVVYSVNATVPTLLENHPLEVKVIQVAFRGPLQKPLFYETFVVAHGQPVVVADVPARNGAIHVITKLLNPLKKPGHHDGHDEQGDEPVFGPFVEDEDEWAGWEEWLPVWAEAQQD